LRNLGLLNIIAIHHERIDEVDSQNGLCEDEINDLESIFILLLNIFPYEKLEFEENDGKKFFYNIISSTDKKLVEKNHGIRLTSMLKHIFDSLPSWEEYDERREAI
jgi:hypothetical protein